MWDNDACMFNCLAHTIFNRTDPQRSYGRFAINNASKYVNASVLDTSTSAVFAGDRFGCQLSLVNQARLLASLKPHLYRVLLSKLMQIQPLEGFPYRVCEGFQKIAFCSQIVCEGGSMC